MRIKIWIADKDTKQVLKQLGTCLTDSPNRALQMYENERDDYLERGINAVLHWKDITDPAAQSLGKRGGKATTPAKVAASRANGQHGGRPKKETNMERKISVKVAYDVDATNAYVVSITESGKTETLTVHTNREGDGLWIDGKQVAGTSQFSAGRNPREAIRHYFKSLP